MLIREIQKKDNEIIMTIIKSSLEALKLDIPGTAYFDPQLNDLYHFYNQFEHANYWIVELDGKVVGGIGIAPFNAKERICELQKLYLVPEAQGLGLSIKLMETALAFAAEHYEKCYLETLHELTAACSLYKKFGFMLLQEPLEGSEHSAMDAWFIKDLNT